MPQETIRVARAVTAEEEDPRGGDAGLNRGRYWTGDYFTFSRSSVQGGVGTGLSDGFRSDAVGAGEYTAGDDDIFAAGLRPPELWR